MGFLGIGAMEAFVILVIALIIFGPGRLPEIMGEAGRMVREFRKATRELTGDFEDSIAEVRGTYRELEEEMRSTASGLQKDAQSMADELNTAVANASNLDDDGRPKTRQRQRAPEKLDQLVEPQARDERELAASARAEKPSDAPAPRRKAAVAGSSNGRAEPADDLLSMGDGDDLLATDDSE